MTKKMRRYSLLWLSTCCLWLLMVVPSRAHWADLSTAEIAVDLAETQIALTYPTKLTRFADDDANGQLSAAEINRHRAQLQTFFQDRIRLTGNLIGNSTADPADNLANNLADSLTDSQNQLATLSVGPRSGSSSPSGQAAPDTHTGLQLTYTWPGAVQGIEIDYDLFVPDAPQASCLATISQSGQFTSHVFTPKQTTLSLAPEGTLWGSGKWALTLIGVFAWGAAHSMSPGHGKTLVGAYLVGERATPLHAIFLAMTTTVTHTLGVFALGLVTLFATRYILPEDLYPWLSLLSGSIVVAIGISLLWRQWQKFRSTSESDHHDHSHHDHSHHDHSHHAHTQHAHSKSHSHGVHSHGGHSHSHLPAQDGEPVTWRSLLFLGFSAGLVPCPAALVLLLGAIAIGSPLSGLILVTVFSLGLSLVLTGLGLLLVYAKQLFQYLPATRLSWTHAWTQWLPMASAFVIMAVGIGISTQSLLQVF